MSPGMLTAPFNSAIAADLGLFGYRITDSTIPKEITKECNPFEANFWDDLDAGKDLWIVAQCCQFCALLLGTVAWLVLAWFKILSCSFGLAASCLFAAVGLQSCTFLIIFDTGFW